MGSSERNKECFDISGVDPPNVPKTRFEVIRWEYFTETHVYLDNEFTNIRPLKGMNFHILQSGDVFGSYINRVKEKKVQKICSFRSILVSNDYDKK